MRRLGKWLLVAIGVVCILLAVALGLFRLLLGQVPEYQGELKAWVSGELGIDVDFAMLDARLGLAGPELTLSDATLGNGFLQAGQASITLDPFALLRGDYRVSRLTLAGVLLTVERDAAGRYRLGESVLEPGVAGLSESVPESVVVRIRDSTLRYIDTPRDLAWQFSDFELEMESDGQILTADGSVTAPTGLAREIVWNAQATPTTDGSGASNWQLAASVSALDLEQLASLVPESALGPQSGVGDLSAAAEWTGGAWQSVTAALDFTGLQIGPATDDNPPFAALALSAHWQRAGPEDWSVRLDDLQLERGGRAWPAAAAAEFALERSDGELVAVQVAAGFVRLTDVEPFVRAFPDSQLAEQWDLFRPEGEISDLALRLEQRARDIVYQIDVRFDQLAVRQVGSTPGLRGISGTIDATEDSGTIVFASDGWTLDWPALFPDAVHAESLAGAVVWRQWPDMLSLTGANLSLNVLGQQALASFELQMPADEQPASLRLDASLASADLVAAKSFLPAPIMPQQVVDWLDTAIIGGRARDVELTFAGPLRAFPFDDGGGELRVTAGIEDAALDYSDGWPVAEGLNGTVEFLNAGFAARASGQVAGNRGEAVSIDIPDMRAPLLTLTADTTGSLASVVEFLRGAPLIAAELGPDFERIAVTDGSGDVTARLDLPLLEPENYRLDARLDVTDGALAVAGLAPPITEINGSFQADAHAVTSETLSAQFLGGPVTATLRPSAREGYRAEFSVEGETTADAVAASFGFEHHDLLAGQTRWRGSLRLPALDPLATTRTHITIESNLTGVALRFPEPLAKPPGDPVNLRLDIDFSASQQLAIRGNLGASRRFVLDLQAGEQGLGFTRGTVRFGGDEPVLPTGAGILVDGHLEKLELDPWFALADDSALANAGPLFLGANLEIVDFHAFGQRLGATDLRVFRGTDDWQIDLDSEAIAGRISAPRGNSTRGIVVADMQRVYLATEGEREFGLTDPRDLPGVSLRAAEFGFGNRQLGRVEATLEPDPRGLVLTRFASATDHYQTELSGSWFQGALGTRTTIDARITSSDIQTALAELGLDPALTGESAELTANVYWDSAPGADWLEHLYGEVDVLVETGSLREIDPGAGRVLGLMSIAALPRRLALDFRDVFQDGFAFDEIRGGFMIIDGNAFTDNLKLDGAAAEVGVVGRTGLRDKDYTQQVVVSSQPGNMLPTVAGLLGGPGAGAALFVFTRLFKKSLDGIGSISYCITGSWDEPTVERLDADATDQAAVCADLPEEMLSDAGNG